MTNAEILQTALHQSAVDANCSPSDFLKSANTLVRSAANPGARAYLSLPFDIDFICYGHGTVASAGEELLPAARAYLDCNTEEPFRLFETPQMNALTALVEPRGYKICFMAEYFLPDVTKLVPLDCPFETRLMTHADFEPLYGRGWSNALCEKRKELDVIGMGAFDGEKLIGLAGASADCDSMWQIGIDVLPEYRGKGVASCLTSRLALAILEKGRVPFYCAAWSNIASVRNAIRSGFRPAWTELTVKKSDFADGMRNPAYVLREAKPDEATAVMELYRRAVGRPGCTWNEYYPAPENLEEDLQNGGLWVYTDRDKIIGAVSVMTGEYMEIEGLASFSTACEISRVTIDMGLSGRGLAAKMLLNLFDILRERGITEVRLLAAKCNPAALKTYEKLGFCIKESRFVYGNDYYLETLGLRR